MSTNAKEDKATYLEHTWSLLEPEGLLVITSCNWTKEELQLQFQDHFQLLETIPTPAFTFGGKTGNRVASLIFRKRLKS